MESSITEIADKLFLIDAMMFDDRERLACYLYDTPERVLIEVGPSVTLHHLVSALDSLGIDDVAAIVVTHIHLDHAGGAGQLAARYPEARIGVHARGAHHLAHPGRLWDSAERIYGEEGMRTMWGPMVPIDEGRLYILEEGSRIALGGGRYLDVLYTPGHAKHHVVFHDDTTGGMYVGDSVGISFPHGHMVQPVTPPPDLDPDRIVEQLHRMSERDPSFLGFAHYGIHPDPQSALAEAEERLGTWVDFAEGLASDPEHAAAKMREWVLDGYRRDGVPDDVIATYDKNTFWPMQPAGIFRWLAHRWV